MNLTFYQTEATNAIIDGFKRKVKPVAVLATGTGKSLIISSLCQRLIKANPNIRIGVITHVAELVEQNALKFIKANPSADVGICSAGLKQNNYRRQIVFAGLQSIYNKDVTFDVIIIDEIHTVSPKDKSMWQKVFDKSPKAHIAGLTATPFRTAGDFDEDFKIVYDYGLKRAVQDGFLVPLTSKYTKTQYNIDGVKKTAGEFNIGDLEKVTNIDSLTQQAVAEIIEAGHNRKKWLIFCNGVNHSFSVRDEFRRMGISCETVTGDTLDHERARILQDYKYGDLKCVTNNAVWTTGLDVPQIDLIGMLRHTMSPTLLLQMAGRATRVTVDVWQYATAQDRKQAIANSDKPNALFMDFAKNIERHGFLDEITGKKKEKGEASAPPMKECPNCMSILHASQMICRDCGHEFPKNTVEKIDELYTGDVMSREVRRIKVTDVMYTPHNLNKPDKIPCLRVKYMAENPKDDISEYICLQHTGFAYQKAIKWWKEMGGIELAQGLTIMQIHEKKYYNTLKKPTFIEIKKEGKYDRVVGYDFNPPPPSESQLDNDDWSEFDIPF